MCVKDSKALFEILKKQPIDIKQIDIIEDIFYAQDSITLAILHVYNYGVISGKRKEREKRQEFNC